MFKGVRKKLHSFLFGSMKHGEIERFGVLSATFFFIIGAYWIVRPLKNALIKDTVGVTAIPFAKKLSVIAVVCLLLLYTKLVDKISKQRLFYIVCGFYSFCFLGMSYLFSANIAIQHRWLGLASYSIIESFGSITVALFWAFVATSVDIKSAKRGYALVFASGQIGALLGTTLVTKAEFFGIPFLISLAAGVILCIPFLIKKFITLSNQNVQAAGQRPGLFEGIKLLLTRPYVLGIFVIAASYEIVVTIFDYQMQILADKHYTTAAYASFNALYGQLVTTIACIFAFAGTRFFMKKCGVRFCLLFFPIVVAGLVGYFYFFPTLWTAFGCMVIIKALSYGFNNPVKEIVYLPTSDAIKFKAKGWIDMFGNRSSKAGGATINGALSGISQGFVEYGILISLGLVGVWLIAALWMGKKFTNLVKEQKVVQ